MSLRLVFASTASAPVPVAVIAALAASACSFTRTDFQECDTNQDCQSVFGLGYACQSDGLCELAERPALCDTRTFPDDLFENQAANADTIVFGSLMDQSVETQIARERAAELALAGANDNSGLQGRDFGLVFCNIEEQSSSETRADNAIAAADYLIDVLGVPAIFGPSSSGDLAAVFTEYQDAGTLFISPSATSPALTGLDGNNPSDDEPGLMWRTAPPDDLQGRAIAADILGLDELRSGPGALDTATSISIIFEEGPYGEGLASVISSEFMARCPAESTCSVELRSYATASQRDTFTTMDGQNAAIEEVVFISSNVDQIVSFLDAAGAVSGFAVDGKAIFLPDAGANQDLIEDGNTDLFDQIRGTRPKPLESGEFAFGLFEASYSARFGESPSQFSFTANSYDAAWMLVYGAAWALFQEGEIVGVNMARGLRRLSSGDLIDVQPSNFGAIRSRFEDGDPVNIQGASGALNYDPETEETSGPIETWQISGATIVPTCDAGASGDTSCVFDPES